MQLGLTGTSPVEITVDHADDFTVTAQPADTINGSATTTFTIEFSPSASGLRTAAVSFWSYDPDDGEFTFAFQVYGMSPRLNRIFLSQAIEHGFPLRKANQNIFLFSGDYSIVKRVYQPIECHQNTPTMRKMA